MVNPVNSRLSSNPFHNPSDPFSKPHVVADHVANKMHADRQAYLFSANSADGTVKLRAYFSGNNDPEQTTYFRKALYALGVPLLRAIRSARCVGSHTLIRVRGGRSGKVVPVTSAPHSPTQSAVRSAIQLDIDSGIDSAKHSATRSHLPPSNSYPDFRSISSLSSPTLSPTPRDGMAMPMSSGRPPLYPREKIYRDFKSSRGSRSPGEEKSDTPPGSPLALTRVQPNLTIDLSVLREYTISAHALPLRAAVRSLAEVLHQSNLSLEPLDSPSYSTASSVPSSPFPLSYGYISTCSSEDSRSESGGDEASVFRAPFSRDFNSPSGSLNSSPVSSEYQLSMDSQPSIPQTGHSSLHQTAPQAWWESPDFVQEPEDLDLGCCCGLDLLVSHLVSRKPTVRFEAHPAE